MTMTQVIPENNTTGSVMTQVMPENNITKMLFSYHNAMAFTAKMSYGN